MILVTGGTGVSGRRIVQASAKLGASMRLLVRDPARAAEAVPEDAELIRGDLDDADSVDAALEGCERALFHVDASPKILDRWRVFEKAARHAGVKQVVRFSVGGARPGHPVRFQDLHGQADELLRKSGTGWTILHPTFFMENLLGFAATVKRDGAIYQPAGDGKAAYVAAEDIGAVAAAALTEPMAKHLGKEYLITGPAELSGADMAAALSAAIGREIKYVNVPEEAARSTMLGGGVPEWNVEGVLELMREVREGRMGGVSDAVERVGGKKPKTIGEWVKENVRAFV